MVAMGATYLVRPHAILAPCAGDPAGACKWHVRQRSSRWCWRRAARGPANNFATGSKGHGGSSTASTGREHRAIDAHDGHARLDPAPVATSGPLQAGSPDRPALLGRPRHRGREPRRRGLRGAPGSDQPRARRGLGDRRQRAGRGRRARGQRHRRAGRRRRRTSTSRPTPTCSRTTAPAGTRTGSGRCRR